MCKIVLEVVLQIIAGGLWFYAGYTVGKHKVYKKWSAWLDRMSEIQKGHKDDRDISDS